MIDILSTDEKFIEWMNTLNIDKRKPRSISKTEHDIMFKLSQIVNKYNKTKSNYDKLGLNSRKYLRLTKDEYEQAYSKNQLTLEVDGVIYKKEDTGKYKNFTDNISDISSFLKTLTGFHKKAIDSGKKLYVVFESGKTQSKARYNAESDTIFINSNKMGNTSEEYGSMRYVILHELGHRYLQYHPQKWNIDSMDWNTTKYSITADGGLGVNEEKFAELFALSHWEKKYPQFQTQIKNFLKNIH